MVREAHFRENYRVKGEWCGAFIYAVLEQDWRARNHECPCPGRQRWVSA